MRLVFEETHCVLDDDLVLEADELDDLFGDPRTDDLDVDLAHVDLASGGEGHVSECAGEAGTGWMSTVPFCQTRGET